MSFERGPVATARPLSDTKRNVGTSKSMPLRSPWLNKCFACGQWVGECFQACARRLSKYSGLPNVLREKLAKPKNQDVPKVPDQEPSTATEGPPTNNTHRTLVHELTEGDRRGIMTVKLPAWTITSNQLKNYLDYEYPNQYSVEMRHDTFTITIDRNKQLPERTSTTARFLGALRDRLF